MRLKKVHSGHGLADTIVLAAMRMMMRTTPPGVVRTLRYRKDYFGKAMSALTHAVMRGPSSWSVGERELFAAFVSRLNQCPF